MNQPQPLLSVLLLPGHTLRPHAIKEAGAICNSWLPGRPTSNSKEHTEASAGDGELAYPDLESRLTEANPSQTRGFIFGKQLLTTQLATQPWVQGHPGAESCDLQLSCSISLLCRITVCVCKGRMSLLSSYSPRHSAQDPGFPVRIPILPSFHFSLLQRNNDGAPNAFFPQGIALSHNRQPPIMQETLLNGM